jgi:DHA1 family bicyclomycin/chloramphenicol resistance-like MFS transporter
MTATGLPTVSGGKPRIRVGSKTFTFVLAMGMAVTALGIDSVLPAFPDIRAAMGLDEDATEVAGLITFFLIGSSAGLLPAGLLADRYGRRAVMLGGLVLYVAGALGALLAPTLPVMFAARFVWGLGSAGPRVAAMAMIRDAYEGDQMAKQMSFMMAVFILVPTFAPAVASGLLRLGPWQLVFWLCAFAGAALLVLSLRLPETLEPADRLALSAGDVWRSCRTVFVTPGTYGYLVALTALFGVFISYIASSEIIHDEVFGLSDWFALFFGAMSLVMGAGMYLNGHIVERVGLDRLSGVVFVANLAAVALLLAVALATDGEPPFWLFVLSLAPILFTVQMLLPNLTSGSMKPLAHVAGTAAAIFGVVPGVVGAIIGSVIDRRFDGTITPLAIGFVVSNSIAWLGWRWAVSAARQAAFA